LFDEFVHVYDRMLQRKQFVPSADIGRHRRIQQLLPESMKMQVVIARNQTGPCAGAIYSALGDTALYLFGATDDAGMKTSASYLVQWAIVKKLKERGVAYYDLNGINPQLNPGTYHFKRGLAGSKAIEVSFAGQFQTMKGSLANRCVEFGDRLRHQMQTRRASAPQGAGAA
jgi:lipid II:glycine glycyltransferase (peptidoglycan interpeptide bridge formation enzyme)